MVLSKLVLSIVSLLFVSMAPGVAFANDYRFCFKYANTTVDGNVGEDYYKTSNRWKARGAKIKVYRHTGASSQIVYDGYAGRSSGCRNITTPVSGGQESFSILMYPQARVHRLSSGNYVYVKAKSPNVSEQQAWVTHTQALSPGTTWGVNSAPSAVARLMAVADFAVYRWFREDTGFPANEGFTVWMENDNCQNASNQNYACASASTVWVPTLELRTRRKFLIGHEIGHLMYQKFYGAAGYPWRCEGDASEYAKCKFHGPAASQSHALQMKVPNSCALSEGFAHFFSTDVFNAHSSTAYFDYYKETYPGKVNVETGPTGGATAYMENECASADDGWSTELDWLRVFWAYHTDSQTNGSKPSHGVIVEHMKDAHNLMNSQTSPDRYYNAYEAMMDSGSSTSARRARFQNRAERNGADH
ncbi:MAG: hypothetical protein V3W41_07480 [Planctomycetota bacterium]